MSPIRIQRCRTPGWRMPEGAVYAGRPTKWGNPINLADVAFQYPSLTYRQIAQMVVRDFEVLAGGWLQFPNLRTLNGRREPVAWSYPSVAEIRSELGGKDLACWCPLDEPCHADVLLNLANKDGAP